MTGETIQLLKQLTHLAIQECPKITAETIKFPESIESLVIFSCPIAYSHIKHLRNLKEIMLENGTSFLTSHLFSPLNRTFPSLELISVDKETYKKNGVNIALIKKDIPKIKTGCF